MRRYVTFLFSGWNLSCLQYHLRQMFLSRCSVRVLYALIFNICKEAGTFFQPGPLSAGPPKSNWDTSRSSVPLSLRGPLWGPQQVPAEAVGIPYIRTRTGGGLQRLDIWTKVSNFGWRDQSCVVNIYMYQSNTNSIYIYMHLRHVLLILYLFQSDVYPRFSHIVGVHNIVFERYFDHCVKTNGGPSFFTLLWITGW